MYLMSCIAAKEYAHWSGKDYHLSVVSLKFNRCQYILFLTGGEVIVYIKIYNEIKCFFQ